MADLVVVAYDGEDTADQVLNKLRQLQKEYLIDLEDAVVVVRDKNGKVRIKQAVPLVSLSAVGGAAWGGLCGRLSGILFLNPLLGWLTVRRVNLDKALPELSKFGGKIIKTSLTHEQEARLKSALEELQRREPVVV